ncbi:C-GCAxxG-C-C family protein [Fulvivirga ulvae]|uniref:C-GCAxxG-C-C family protein n=1 Tax=Fulvivirga ulvae TaxID=2904245 RepID=UPI001F2DFC24|nr:C-GCAxxG-C-C family protein [Fulvivirga ulvae]UII31926.1 C-GCAxxG-C-C family protein [Fulvivirga ulvae]
MKAYKDGLKVLSRGTCGTAFCSLLNEEYGVPNEVAEVAASPFAGGLLNRGYQCGLIGGAVLAAGAESYRRNEDTGTAVAMAITATQHLMQSFTKRTNTISCRDITDMDLSGKLAPLKVLFTGKAFTCMKLAGKWAPEAIKSADEGLSDDTVKFCPGSVSCASEVVKKMGGTDEEMLMVAGYAGGLGLSGKECGALSAAIWYKMVDWLKKNPGKSASSFDAQEQKKMLRAFYVQTDSEVMCSKITGKEFKDIDDHSDYIKNGGCKKIIDALAAL